MGGTSGCPVEVLVGVFASEVTPPRPTGAAVEAVAVEVVAGVASPRVNPVVVVAVVSGFIAVEPRPEKKHNISNKGFCYALGKKFNQPRIKHF